MRRRKRTNMCEFCNLHKALYRLKSGAKVCGWCVENLPEDSIVGQIKKLPRVERHHEVPSWRLVETGKKV